MTCENGWGWLASGDGRCITSSRAANGGISQGRGLDTLRKAAPDVSHSGKMKEEGKKAALGEKVKEEEEKGKGRGSENPLTRQKTFAFSLPKGLDQGVLN